MCKSHNTNECKRWSEDGENISRRARAEKKEFKALKRNFSTLLKEQRKLKKSIKKKARKSRKKKKRDDDSSSSDSSDSE